MQKRFLLISFIIISLLIFAGCKKSAKETPASEEIRSAAPKIEAQDNEPVSSFSDFEQDVKIYRDAVSAKDAKQCDLIKTASVKTKCLEKTSK